MIPALLLAQIPGSAPTTETGAMAQLIAALALLLGAVAVVIFKLLDRRDRSKDGSTGGDERRNGLNARLEALEAGLLASERRGEERMVRMREDVAQLQADFLRRFERMEDRWDEWLRDKGAKS